MNITDRISTTPGVRSGKPCVRGTRITVVDVLEYLGGGMSEKEMLDDFPTLCIDDIRACQTYAAEFLREPRRVSG